jgi:SAM-dependent methyltransferase
MNETKQFYAGLTPFYHLIYPDWEASMQRQASQIDSIMQECWGTKVSSVLDLSCGIGTQALGLAKLGYEVTASDLSPEEVERGKAEAERRGLKIGFSVADMRDAFGHHAREFDVVISCDNSVPHLLTDEHILSALCQFFRCTRQGGGCLITVRDYEREDLSKPQIKPYGIRDEHGVRWLLWQVWDPHGATYDVTMYFVEDRGKPECRTHAWRSTYYAIGIPRLMELMTQAGFEEVRRIDGRFFQPVVVGTKRPNHGLHCGLGLSPEAGSP